MTGAPSRTATVLGACDAGGVQILGLDPPQPKGHLEHLRSEPSPNRVGHAGHPREIEPEGRRQRRSTRLPGASARCPGACPRARFDVEETSSAISAPELAAPTTRTSPSCSWDGLRYWLE